MKKNYLKFLTVALMGAPLVTFAQTNNIEEFLQFIMQTIQMIIPIIIGIAVVVFLWGILSYVVAKDDDKKSEARSIILYGTIVLFVMVSIWGLVNLLDDTLGLNNAVPKGPGIPTSIQN